MGLDVIMWKVSTREAKGDKGDGREGGSKLVLVDHDWTLDVDHYAPL